MGMQQLTWTLVSCTLVVFQMKYAVNNIFYGLIWFLLPCSLVVCNDTMAYFAGLTFGKRFIKAPLTVLSPNKTWEGFIGGFILTVVFAYFWPLILNAGPWRHWLI